MRIRWLIPLLLSVIALGQADYPQNYEVLCPVGATPLLGGSYNPVTHRERAFICVDSLGNVSFASTLSATAFPLLAPNGSQTTPQYSFASTPNSGMFSNSTSVQFSTNGVQDALINPSNGGYFAVVNHLSQSVANTWSAVATCASSTVAVTFAVTYAATPVIVISDETTTGGARVSTKSATGFTITCTGATDVVDWIAVGNPT